MPKSRLVCSLFSLLPCATPPLVGPLEVWRYFAGDGRLASRFPFHFSRARDFDRETPFPFPGSVRAIGNQGALQPLRKKPRADFT